MGPKKSGRTSPPSPIPEGVVTPAATAEPQRKRYRDIVRFSNSRQNSEKKTGQVPDKPLTLYPSQGKQSSNKKEWLETFEFIVSQEYRHCFKAVKAQEYTPWQPPNVTKEDEAQMSFRFHRSLFLD